MKARDVMTHSVVSIAPDAPISQAIARMISHQLSGMPVIEEGGRLVGMVTEGDFLRRAEIGTEAPRRRWVELLLGPASGADDYMRSHGRAVRNVMSPHVVTVGPDTPLAEVTNLMEEHAIKRIPVVDGDRVVGIVSRADLMSALAQRLTETKPATASDDAIRRRIQAEIRKQTWCPLHSVRVTVRDGFVELSGMIFDEKQRQALRVLVENVEGVKEIRDHLKWIEPLAGAPAED